MSEVPGNGFRHAGETAARSFAGPLPPHAPAVADEFAWNLPWYVAYAKARQEHVAKENLLRQGYSVYLPQMKVLRRIRGHHQPRLEPLFPRYLFVQPGSAEHSIAPVRSTIGVAGIVRFSHDPAVIRPETLRGIRELELRQSTATDEELSPFRPGERIRVAEGPLSGLEGLVSSASQHRIVVLMQLLGRDTRVSMNCDQLLVLN